MPQVRAIASYRLQQRGSQLASVNGDADVPDAAHYALIARDITTFLERPMEPFTLQEAPAAPPGAPIGEPALEWISWRGEERGASPFLRWFEPYCSWQQ
jgi:hypothetical protein